MVNVTAGVTAGLAPRRAAGIVRVDAVAFARVQVFVPSSVTIRSLVAVVVALNRQFVAPACVRVTLVALVTLGLKTAATDGVRVMYPLALRAAPVVKMTVNVVGVAPAV